MTYQPGEGLLEPGVQRFYKSFLDDDYLEDSHHNLYQLFNKMFKKIIKYDVIVIV